MSQPSFLGDGSNPRKTDARWFRLAKILGAMQDNCGGPAINNPRLTDTQRILEQKILCTASGQLYGG